MGAFGSGLVTPDPNPLVETIPRISVRDLPPIGKTIALGWQGAARAPLTRLSRTADGLVIAADGVCGLCRWGAGKGSGLCVRSAGLCGISSTGANNGLAAAA
jgi:hypothetical protein